MFSPKKRQNPNIKTKKQQSTFFGKGNFFKPAIQPKYTPKSDKDRLESTNVQLVNGIGKPIKNQTEGNPELDYEKFQNGMVQGENRIRLIPFPNGKRLNNTKSKLWNENHPKGIVVENGVKPSDAIRELSKNPQDFNIECGTYCQAIILTGMLNSMGDEKFNAYIRQAASDRGEPNLVLRNRRSTGIKVKKDWQSPEKSKYLMDERTNIVESKDIIQNAEIGTIICLKSKFLKGTPYYRENIVKVGDDKFMAQGVGYGAMSMKEIKKGLVDIAIKAKGLKNTRSIKKEIEKSLYVRTVTEHHHNIKNK